MKYLGGKKILGKYISEVIKAFTNDTQITSYIEPFCGALGVFVHMTDHFNKCYASDLHGDLIEMWKKVQNGTFRPPKTMTEERFLKIKEYKSPNSMKAFVGFGCSFGGKYFGGYAQKYTNGKKEDFLKEATNSIRKIAPKIQNATFKCQSYDAWKPTKSIIYCDPPYVHGKFPVKYRTSTKKYLEFDSEKFWNQVRKWSKHNVVFVSEKTAPDDFIAIWKKRKQRSISQSKKTRFKDKNTKKYSIEQLFIHKSLVKKTSNGTWKLNT